MSNKFYGTFPTKRQQPFDYSESAKARITSIIDPNNK
jgi:hypothetical protein